MGAAVDGQQLAGDGPAAEGEPADRLGHLVGGHQQLQGRDLGGALLVLFVVGLFQPLFDYWRIEPNEFVHYVQPWGRDQSVPRQGSTVTREVPDVRPKRRATGIRCFISVARAVRATSRISSSMRG